MSVMLTKDGKARMFSGFTKEGDFIELYASVPNQNYQIHVIKDGRQITEESSFQKAVGKYNSLTDKASQATHKQISKWNKFLIDEMNMR